MKESIILLLACLCLVDSILLTFRSNVTLGLILMYLVTAALFLYWRFGAHIDAFCRYGVGRILKYCFLAGAFFFLVLCLLMTNAAKKTVTGQEKAVIILGAGLHRDVVSDTLARRLDAAIEEYAGNPQILFLVSGGQGPQETRTEAAAMAGYLTAHGIPADRILQEDRSVSTETNFLYSAQLMRQAGLSLADPVAFVTNDFHCYRSIRYAEKAGFTNVRCLSATTSPIVLPAAAMREALAICALWAHA